MRRRRLVGLALAATLELYAEEGKAYIEKLQDTVRDNGLWRLDGARSSDGPVIKLFPSRDRPPALRVGLARESRRRLAKNFW